MYCRDDLEVIKEKGRRAGFYRGANSLLCHHIASFHYKEYSHLSKEAGIEESPQAIPEDIKAAREAAVKGAAGQKGGQQTLDGMVKKVQTLTVFSSMELLDHITQHIVCCDEVCNFPYLGGVAENLELNSIHSHLRSQTWLLSAMFLSLCARRRSSPTYLHTQPSGPTSQTVSSTS